MTYACPCTRQITTAAARNRVWHFDQAQSERQTPKDNKRNNRTGWKADRRHRQNPSVIRESYSIMYSMQCRWASEFIFK